MIKQATLDQRELFELFDEFFQRATGKTAKAFAPLDSFSEAVPALVSRFGEIKATFDWGIPALHELYKRQKSSLFEAAKDQGGLKVVLGGSSRFGKTQLNAVRRLVLYADTILIPDPVLAWIETERPEEKYRNVKVLEALFFILRLKPFVDSESAYPSIIVFPSFDRSLAQFDPETQAQLEQFAIGMFSEFLGKSFSAVEELMSYVREEPNAFLQTVSQKNLFVAPGGPLNEPLNMALDRYRKEFHIWRTGKHLNDLDRLTDAELVFNAIHERLEPQYHLIENSTELHAQPLLALEQQAHYFKLCASASEGILEGIHVVSQSTRSVIDVLSRQRHEWLSNVPVKILVEMRLNNENEKFRERLSRATKSLTEADLENLDRVASETAREIDGLLNEHRQAIRDLQDKYKMKFLGQALESWISIAPVLIPHLSPLIACIPVATLASKYLHAKVEQRSESRKVASSLLGVLAIANDAAEEIE